MREILSDEKVQIPDDEIDKLIAEADLNHDNEIDYSEFLEMMKKDLKEKLQIYKMNFKDLLVFKPQCSIF